jgi:hypothetical protein
VLRRAQEEMQTEPAVKPPVIGFAAPAIGIAAAAIRAVAIVIGTTAILFALPTHAFAQINMPDPKEMSGLPRPVGDLPDGAISVRLIRGQLSNNITNFPVELHGGDKTLTVKTDETGRAQFEGIKPGTMVHAVATVDGERLESREFAVPASGGIRLMLVATAREGAAGAGAPAPALPAQAGIVVLGGNTRFVVEMSDDGPQLFYLLDIQNTAKAPVNPPKPFVIELPAGASNATLMEGSTPQALLKGTTLTVNGPFAPGRTIAQVAFLLDPSGTVRISQTLPAQLEQLSVVVRKLGDVTVTSPQLTNRQEVPADGQMYIMATGGAVAAGTPIALEIDGLPHHSAAPRYLALALAVLIVVVGTFTAVAPKESSAAAARRQQLRNRREKLFADLVRIEQQRRAGQIDPEPYAQRRQTLMAQLERVYGELDQRSGVRGGNEGLAA